MKYSILLVVHNHVELTKLCLDSIYRHSPRQDFELLILDNASSDTSRVYLRYEMQRRGNIRLFFNDKNQGFMSPMNYLAAEATGEYLVILNNDLQVCNGWLQKMEAAFGNDPKIALVGLSQNCGEIGPDGGGIHVKTRLEYIEASCMMVPKAIVDKHGLFDDKYFSFGYYEDSDLSLRLRERGYKIAVIPLPILHRRNCTMGKLSIDIDGIRAKNAELFRQRWANYLRRRTFEKTVLFKRTMALGDVIMATPIVEAYKEKFPYAKITFATRYPQVFEGNPNIERVFDLTAGQLDPGRFDEFYDLDLAYEVRPTMNVVKAYAAKVGINTNGNRPRIYTAKQNGKAGKLAIIHPERIMGWPGRNAPMSAFTHAAADLNRRGYKIIEVGTTSSSLPGAEYRKTNFKELCALISSASIFVGHDSGPFHIAQAYGVPSVIPFGAVKPELRDCSGKVFPVVVEDIECLGCHHYQKPPQITQSCLRKRPICMERITGQMMSAQITRALEVVK
ncbi:MAG: glycosyltransferase [Candidatus Omnitrophota bacterium]